MKAIVLNKTKRGRRPGDAPDIPERVSFLVRIDRAAFKKIQKRLAKLKVSRNDYVGSLIDADLKSEAEHLELDTKRRGRK